MRKTEDIMSQDLKLKNIKVSLNYLKDYLDSTGSHEEDPEMAQKKKNAREALIHLEALTEQPDSNKSREAIDGDKDFTNISGQKCNGGISPCKS